MMRTISAIGVAALLALGGCGNKKDSPAATAGSGSAVATAGSGSATAAAGSGSATAAGSGSATAVGSGGAAGSGSAAAIAVPTEEDFEKDATTKITDKNVEAQVQALEKELEAK